mmetsp:Transcript_4031/g.9322  ORF Transcript_4031/g.9322 Transcript_4031/m.9322 type:complete len:2885 (+) Transcript_4031:789-9443(+)
MDVDSDSQEAGKAPKEDLEARDDSESDEDNDKKPAAKDLNEDEGSANDDDDDDDASKSENSESGDDESSDDSGDSSDDSDGSDDSEEGGISDYEKLRMERIKRNQQRLQQLGLAGKSGTSAFASLKPAAKPVQRKPRKKVERTFLPQRSSRSRSAKKGVSYATKYDFRGKDIIKVTQPGGARHAAKKPRVVRWIHDEFRRIGRQRKHNLKSATRSLKAAGKELNYWSRRMQVFAEKKQRIVHFEKKMEQDKKEREELGGYTRSELLREIDRRTPQLEGLLLKYDIQEANVAKSEEERQALLERMMQREAFGRKIEMIDALDRFPKALRDATTSLNLMLYNRSPKDPAPPRRSKRNSTGGDQVQEEEEGQTKDGDKGEDGWTNMVVEKPTVPTETATKNRKKEVRNVGGWVSPVFGQELDRAWLERENALQNFDLDSYVPQVGDTILYYPGVHKAFLKKNPDMLWRTTRNPLRVPLWQRAFKERKKGITGGADTWWTNDWLDSPDLEAYPLVCRVERTYAEFPPDPYAHYRTVDKDGNVVWKHPKNLKPKKKKTGMRLAVLLKPLTPLLPPTFDEEKGLMDDKKCALPPKFYVSTAPMKKPFVVPFVWTFALTHSIRENEAIELPDKESNKAKVKAFHGLESSQYGSFRLDDKVQLMQRILDDLESTGVGGTSMQDRIEQQMTYNDSGNSFSATDAGLIVSYLKAYLDERGDIGKTSKAEASGNLLDLIRSCLPLSQNVEVQPDAYHRKTIRVSRWDLRRKKSTKALPGIQSGCLHSLEDSLRTKIAFAIEESVKEIEFCDIFVDAVTDEDAPGYSCAVPIGMYFNRILNRLKVTKGPTCYYTSVESVLSDLQCVADNCLLYNSLNSDIAKLCGDIVLNLKRQVSDVFSKHVKEQSNRIKAEQERRRFVLENCGPSIVGDDTSKRRGKGHVVPDWVNSPYEGNLHRKWMQRLDPDGSWTIDDGENQEIRIQNWAPQSGDVVHYSRSLHAQFVKGHMESFAKEQCIVPRFSNTTTEAANDEDAENDIEEATGDLSQKLQTHWLVGSIVSVRSTFPRKEETDESFDAASPVLAIGLRFPYPWAKGKVFTVCWRPCSFTENDKCWKCSSCSLGMSSFLRPAWLAKDEGQREYEVLECSGESKLQSETGPTGIPESCRTSITTCFDILKKRCLAETDPDSVDPKSCFSNAERGLVTKPPTSRLLPSFEALVSEAEEAPSSLQKKAPSRKNSSTKDAKDKKEANARNVLSRICFLPPWSGPGAAEKEDSTDTFKTKLPLPYLSLELICLRVKNGYYRQPAAILNDLTESYVTAILYMLSDLVKRKRNQASVRKIAKYLNTTTKSSKPTKLIDAKEAKQKTRSHESVAKSLTPVARESLFDNEEFQGLKSEEQEWIRRIEKTRKLYSMAILCVTDTDLLRQIFGLPMQSDEADGAPQDNSTSEEEIKLREEGISHIRYLLSSIAKDPSDLAPPFTGQMKVRFKCNGKIATSGLDDSEDARVLGPNELGRNDELCRVLIGQPGRRAACVRCQVAGSSMLSCRVANSHANVDFAFSDFFKNGRGVDGLIAAATPNGTSTMKGGGQSSTQAIDGSRIVGSFESGLADPTENFKKSRTTFELAKMLHKEATMLTQTPARLGDDFIRSYFPVDESDGHYIYCIVCGRSGDLVCCEGCPTVVHADCIGFSNIPDDDWYCKECTSSRGPKDQDQPVADQPEAKNSGNTETSNADSRGEVAVESLPKSPVPSYFQFLNERRKEIQDQNPGASKSEISKILSNLWKSSSDEVRKKYMEEEANQRKAYQLAIAEYRKSKAGKQIDEAQSYESAMKFLESVKEQRKKAQQADSGQKVPEIQPTGAQKSNDDVAAAEIKEISTSETKTSDHDPLPSGSAADSTSDQNVNVNTEKPATEVEQENIEQNAEAKPGNVDGNPITAQDEGKNDAEPQISERDGGKNNEELRTAPEKSEEAAAEPPAKLASEAPTGPEETDKNNEEVRAEPEKLEEAAAEPLAKLEAVAPTEPEETDENDEEVRREPEKLEEAVAEPPAKLEAVAPTEPEETDDFDYLDEVLNRAREASQKDCARKCPKGVGLLVKKKNAYCHICHKRADTAYGFACRHDTHNYCLRHAMERFDFGSEKYQLDHCPICCLSCKCSACKRKINNLAREFKQHCRNTNKTGKEAKFKGILDRCAAVSGARLTSFVAWDDELSTRDTTTKQNINFAAPIVTEPIERPKKASSAYFFFCKEFRRKIFEDDPKTEFREVGKILGERWRALDEEGRKKYEDISNADKERYEKEMDEYHEKLEKAASAAASTVSGFDEKAVPQEDIPLPQKPYPAYFQFANSKRVEVKKANPGVANSDVSRMIADMWRNLTDEAKQYYVDEETKQRKKYNEEMEEYRKKMEERYKMMAAQRPAQDVTPHPAPTAPQQVSPELLPEAIVYEQMQNLEALLKQLSSLHPKTAYIPRRKNIPPPVVPTGTKLKKHFDDHGEFEGKIIRIPDEESDLYGVEYEDEDEEELTLEELLPLLSESVREDYKRAQRDYEARLNRKRGRPRKSEIIQGSDAENDPEDEEYLEESKTDHAPKRKRGRPRKILEDEEAPRRKRGRPRKVDPSVEVESLRRKRKRSSDADLLDSQPIEGTPQKRGRGRPRKEERSSEPALKRPRGRPRKRQLEEEDLQASNATETKPRGKRGRPRKRPVEEPQVIVQVEREESPEDPNKRRSKRSTKFRKIMRDAASESVRDLFAGSNVSMTLGSSNPSFVAEKPKGRRSQTPPKRLVQEAKAESDPSPVAETSRGRRSRPPKRFIDDAKAVVQEPVQEPVAETQSETRRGRRSRTPKRFVQSPEKTSKKKVQPQQKRAKSLPPTTSTSTRRTRHSPEKTAKESEGRVGTRRSRRRG